MKTNEVQKVSEHLKKVSFQLPIWKLPELRGEGLFIFFHKILLRSFVTVNLPSRTHRESIPRCFPTRLLEQTPGSFPIRLPRGLCRGTG